MRFPAPLLVLTLNSSWTNTIGIGSAQSAPHHFYAVDHSTFAQLSHIVTMALVCTTSLEQHKSRWSWSPLHRFQTSHILLSRWPWSSPLHRNSASLGPQPPPRFESSRLLDLSHLTHRFSLPRGCARFSVRIRRLPCLSPLAATQETPLQQPNSSPSSSSISISCRSSTPSFRCLQRLTRSKRVSSPTSSSCTWLVVTTAISLQCDDIFQHPADVRHNGIQVFSLPLHLRDRCVSSTSLLLLQILVHRTPTLLTTRPCLSVLLTIPQASEPRASMLRLSLTIVLSRRRPSRRLYSSQSVRCPTKYLATRFNNSNKSTSAFVVRDLTSFVANTTSILSSAMHCNRPDPDM